MAWLNLDIGFDICISEHNDAYMKTWLDLLFPIYILAIVSIIIIGCKYSETISNLFGRKDPVATMATLIVLSYTKVLHSTIGMLSFARLEYTNSSDQDVVWRLDGNVRYLHEKHIALFIVALIILLLGIPFTLILLCWQWLLQMSEMSFFLNAKVQSFMEMYCTPLHDKHRYWIGMLLLVRVILYFIAGVEQSGDPQVQLMATAIVVSLILLIKLILSSRVYKKQFVDILESLFLFNLLALSTFMLYAVDKQKAATAAAYLSTMFTFLLLLVIFGYHINGKCAYLKPKYTLYLQQKLSKSTLTDTRFSSSEGFYKPLKKSSDPSRRDIDLNELGPPEPTSTEIHIPYIPAATLHRPELQTADN